MFKPQGLQTFRLNNMERNKTITKVVQITSGQGPAECCWVVAHVLKTLLGEIKQEGFEYSILHREKGVENGTLQSVTLQIKGVKTGLFLSTWIGTIQWIGVSSFRPKHKRKNWFIGVQDLKRIAPLEILDKDISYQATKASGPGGQHVNKVSSAIRAIHKPTQAQVVVMDSRSQHQNKKIAKQRLQQKVVEVQEEKMKANSRSQWKNHLNLQRGNPVKVFVGTDFKIQRKEKTFKRRRNRLKTELRNELKN